MQLFKKRARLLAEKLGGNLGYGRNESLTINFDEKFASFEPESAEGMKCTVGIGGDTSSYSLSKSYIFDVIEKLGIPHLARCLLDYEAKPILELGDYIRDEDGQERLEQLRQQIMNDPSLVNVDLGGNRILVEYYRGVLVISDDILWCATNVVDFSIGSLEK